jgi:small conductance mechanosensitive channel
MSLSRDSLNLRIKPAFAKSNSLQRGRWWRKATVIAVCLVVPLSPLQLHWLQVQEREVEDAPAALLLESPTPPQVPPQTEDGLFFADVLVRGQPVLQVGSLAGLSASDRAQMINRRIVGLLSQTRSLDPVTVQRDGDRQIALLVVNNRVLMTVTQQDAADFGVTVDVLAEQWAAQLNQALAQPNLAVDVLQRVDGTSRQWVRSTIDLLPSLS